METLTIHKTKEVINLGDGAIDIVNVFLDEKSKELDEPPSSVACTVTGTEQGTVVISLAELCFFCDIHSNYSKKIDEAIEKKKEEIINLLEKRKKDERDMYDFELEEFEDELRVQAAEDMVTDGLTEEYCASEAFLFFADSGEYTQTSYDTYYEQANEYIVNYIRNALTVGQLSNLKRLM